MHFLRHVDFIRQLSLVSGFTCISRLLGFFRDMLFAYFLGNGLLSDIFFLALRVPNHLRTFFADGALNTAFVHVYSSIRAVNGVETATVTAGRVLCGLVITQLTILVMAEFWMASIVEAIAPKLAHMHVYGQLTVFVHRITFPYLATISLSTLFIGVLNANGYFALPSGTQLVFNVAIILGTYLGYLYSWGEYGIYVSYGAAIGVLASGVVQLVVLVWYCRSVFLLPLLEIPRLTPDVILFLKRFFPAMIGAGAGHVSSIVDTILAASLSVGSLSALYYADRLYQLPIGIIIVALGSVLLPRLSNLYASGAIDEAWHLRRQAFIIGLTMVMPFAIVCVIHSEFLIRSIFAHGMFKGDEVFRAARTLSAYGYGLPAVVLLRVIVSSFHARGDTTTPMLVGLLVLIVNVVSKFILIRYMDVGGLAASTSISVWLNTIVLWSFLQCRDRTW